MADPGVIGSSVPPGTDATWKAIKDLQVQGQQALAAAAPIAAILQQAAYLASLVTYAGVGSGNAVVNVNATVPVTWLTSTFHPAVSVVVPEGTSGKVQVVIGGRIALTNPGATTTSSTGMTGYISYNHDGTDDGLTTASLTFSIYGPLPGIMAGSYQAIETLDPGTYTFRIAIGYEHSGTNNGSLTVSNPTLSVQILP